MESFNPGGAKASLNRRSFLSLVGVVAAGSISTDLSSAAEAERGVQPFARRRRKLGSLEVSSIGFGVQNMSRSYETLVPYRPEMINIIRAAYDHGVTFFDTCRMEYSLFRTSKRRPNPECRILRVSA